ncbi:MAG: aldehyde ferredoxin oxidoreductase N-terminal domain-containing protein, partial [Candidatus Methanomethylicaceae archaeon]
MYGYNGKILKVDLSTEDIKIEELEEEVYRKYLGGRGLALYFLLREAKPKIDPFDPYNVLIFATSIITGAPLPGLSRCSVVSKSPLTNSFGEAEAGGFFGSELKFAGFDVIIINGVSKDPVYLWIH